MHHVRQLTASLWSRTQTGRHDDQCPSRAQSIESHRGLEFRRLIDVSLSETLSRTIITGGPTILSLLAFFAWGTGALVDFALTLVVGTIVGTYSSMYVAVPFTAWLDRKYFSKRKTVARRSSLAKTERAASS
jgi:preprotein translocase subunit SecF